VRLRRAPAHAPPPIEALAARLVEEMVERWRRGERPRAEELLARHPELQDHPEAAADLIYEEVCLRQEQGEEVSAEEVLARFPRWRAPLAVLLDCQRLLGPTLPAPQFPQLGDVLGDFRLLAELGRGGQGRVFLAQQLSLADRPVVLKLTPPDGREHLSLARLQHTFIVPLHSAQDYPAQGLRALCMPYFGGATLAHVLDGLRGQSPARRTGQALLEALDQAQARAPLSPAGRGPARAALARASYPRAVAWVGACLGEALQYAHDRGLLHLDLKPSNVLLTADAQPMLLDFHLAQPPLTQAAAVPPCVGGTVGYMSPEQSAALLAAELGQPAPQPIDGRSDVYSLALVLYEALAGELPGPGASARALRRTNREVSPGLAAIVGKCLAQRPERRYATAAALGDDLRRHLADLPLKGVSNRSLLERWRKWRRRRPNGLARAGALLAVLAAVCAAAAGALGHLARSTSQARAALRDGQAHLSAGRPDEARSSFERGLGLARGVPFQAGLVRDLERHARLAEQARAEADRAAALSELHLLADRIRFLHAAGPLSAEETARLDACCRAVWEKRRAILGPGERRPAQARDDLLDLAILWADLLSRRAPAEEGRTAALAVLDQAEELFGPSPVLDRERLFHAPAAPRRPPTGGRPPRKAWEHYALGRSLLRAGDLARADAELARAVGLEPHALWPNFYLGVCAHRLGRYEEAAEAFSACIGAAPGSAGCFYNRALAHAARGRADLALRDCDQAVRLGAFAPAALARARIHYRAKRYDAALADLRLARSLGADPKAVQHDLALVERALRSKGR
jgi:serine/threonine protein kinase